MAIALGELFEKPSAARRFLYRRFNGVVIVLIQLAQSRIEVSPHVRDLQVVAGVQQLFPPGTFVLVALTPAITALPLSPLVQGQCILLQVTDDVAPGADDDEWIIPIAAGGFNNLAGLLADPGGDECAAAAPPCRDDWDPSAYVAQIATVVPLGRLRWSRYEIDYTVPALPYLVRYDFIGYQPAALGSGPDYPHCTGGACPQPRWRAFRVERALAASRTRRTQARGAALRFPPGVSRRQ